MSGGALGARVGGEKRILTCSRGSYQCLASSFDDYMVTLVRMWPEVILGRYLAVTMWATRLR